MILCQVSYHDERVKRIILLDISIFQDDRRYLLSEIKVPVAWFVGGPKDMGYPNAEKDYAKLNAGLPSYKASLDTGHGGTYVSEISSSLTWFPRLRMHQPIVEGLLLTSNLA